MFNFGKKVLYLRIVIASLFKDLGDSKMLIYCLGLLVALSTLLSGLILTNKKRRRNKWKLYLFYQLSDYHV
jgi:hypothetical protein|uniref:DUF6722 family protein n=1 Tax=Phocaeicola coprophilus TaxID=387090 RepID=UPI0027958554|nr:DUF6722 family protein [Phocaeicola coprophilus]